MRMHMDKWVFVALAVMVGGYVATAAASDPMPNKAATANVSSETAAKGTAPATDTWRFVRHEGHWWYYLPSGKFVYWNGSAWVNPAVAVNPSAGRRFSYEPGYNAPATGTYPSYGRSYSRPSYSDPAFRRADSKILGF